MSHEGQAPILLCLDLEIGSGELIRYAMTEAMRSGSPLQVLSVLPKVRGEKSHAAARERLEAMVSRALEATGTNERPELIVEIPHGGRVEDEILHQIEALHPAMVILGRRRHHGKEHMFIQSSTACVLADLSVPVLVVPIPAEEKSVVGLDK